MMEAELDKGRIWIMVSLYKKKVAGNTMMSSEDRLNLHEINPVEIEI